MLGVIERKRRVIALQVGSVDPAEKGICDQRRGAGSPAVAGPGGLYGYGCRMNVGVP